MGAENAVQVVTGEKRDAAATRDETLVIPETRNEIRDRRPINTRDVLDEILDVTEIVANVPINGTRREEHRVDRPVERDGEKIRHQRGRDRSHVTATTGGNTRDDTNNITIAGVARIDKVRRCFFVWIERR